MCRLVRRRVLISLQLFGCYEDRCAFNTASCHNVFSRPDMTTQSWKTISAHVFNCQSTKSGGKHRCVTEPDTVSMVTYRVFSDFGAKKSMFQSYFLA